MLPAAVPRRRAHRRRLLRLYTGSVLNFVENPETVPRTCARSRRRCSPPCRGVGEVLLRRHHRAERRPSTLQQLGLRLGHRRRPAARRRPLCWRASRCRVVAGARTGSLARAGQRAQADRHPPRASCVTGAAPISPDLIRWYLALGVPMLEVWGQTGTGGVDRCRSAHQARHHRPGLPVQRGAARPEGEIPRARTSSWAT